MLPKTVLDKSQTLGEWNILTTYRGSITHGTWRSPIEPTSIDDKDVLGVCVPPLDYYLRLRSFNNRGTLEIKEGEWTLDQVKAEADRWFKLSEEAYISSTLPPGPDLKKVEQLKIAVVRLALNDRRERL